MRRFRYSLFSVAMRSVTLVGGPRARRVAEVSKPTVKQHLAAIRKLFVYLTTGGILESNPSPLPYRVRDACIRSAISSRGPSSSVRASTIGRFIHWR
jgi:hypothetical protein